MEEEEFYGGGKGERDPRRKEKERMIRKGSGIVKRERRGNPLIKEDIGRRRRRSLEGREKGFFEDQSSRLLGLVFCLVMVVELFHRGEVGHGAILCCTHEKKVWKMRFRVEGT